MKGSGILSLFFFVAFAAAGTMMDHDFESGSQLEKKEVGNLSLGLMGENEPDITNLTIGCE